MSDIVPFKSIAQNKLDQIIGDAERDFPSLSFSGLRTQYDRFCGVCNKPLLHKEVCTPSCTPRTLDAQTAVAEGILMLHLS